ncbi:hypothetical protein GCM10010295_29160 [Streptomyces intermedius]
MLIGFVAPPSGRGGRGVASSAGRAVVGVPGGSQAPVSGGLKPAGPWVVPSGSQVPVPDGLKRRPGSVRPGSMGRAGPWLGSG